MIKLKELVKLYKEMDFKSKKAFQKYAAKHKMRKSTKVSIAGKETTAGEASKKKGKKKDWDKHAQDAASAANAKMDKDSKPDYLSADDWSNMDADEKEYHTSGEYAKDSEMDDTGKVDDKPYTDDDEEHGGGGDVGGPAHPNVPKGAKTSKQAKDMKKKTKKSEKEVSKIEKNMMSAADAANARMDAAEWLGDKENIDSFNKMAADGEPVQFDTDDGRSLTWEDGEGGMFNSVIATDEDGAEVEVRFDDIVRFDKPPTKTSPKEELKKWKEADKKAMDTYGDYLNNDAGLSDKFKKDSAAMKRLARDLMNKDFAIPGTEKARKRGAKLAKSMGIQKDGIIRLGSLLAEGKWKGSGKYLYTPSGEMSSIPGNYDRDAIMINIGRDMFGIYMYSGKLYMRGPKYDKAFSNTNDLAKWLNKNKATYTGIDDRY